MNFATAFLSRKTGTVMEWNVNNTLKGLKDMDVTLMPNLDPLSIGSGSSEKGSSVPVVRKRKKTMTSVYLKFFETATDGKSRKCKFCGQSYSIATATGNLGRHLSNRHPGYDNSEHATTSSTPEPISLIKPKSLGKLTQVDYDHLNWLLIKWLILTSLPPSTLEEKWLANSFKFLNPSVQLWPSEKYQAVFHEVFRSMQDDVRVTLEQVSSKVSLTLDFWTSYEQIFYMSITCQWIDENWFLQKLLLDICHIPFPCGGPEISHSLMKVLKMYKIESRVLSCTHDNSQNAMHACHALKEFMDAQELGPFCYLPCAAHALNLLIDDGLGTTKAIISKIREFVLEINSSVQIAKDFIQLTTAYQEGSWKFPLDCSTRWSGNYQMLDIVRKASKSMDAVTRKYDDRLGSRMLLSSAEKNAVDIIHAQLEPLHKMTSNMCKNKLLTVGLVNFFMDHISEMITSCRDSHHYPDWLKNSAEDMAKDAQRYKNQVCNIFIYMTAILDPRIKVELIPEFMNVNSYVEEARTHFIKNYSTSHFPSMVGQYGAQEIEDGGGDAFAEEIARKRRRGSMTTDELTQYLSEPPAPMPTDVLEWWKVNSTRYPRLSMMARNFLAVQATSVAPQELFYSKGDEIEKQRLSIPHSSTQVLLCIRSWTQGGMRLKYKSTEIDCEKLMEL